MTALWRLEMYNLTLLMSSLISFSILLQWKVSFWLQYHDPVNTGTPLIRTLSVALSGSVLTGFDCTLKNKRTVPYKELSPYHGPETPHQKTRLDSTAQGFKNISIVWTESFPDVHAWTSEGESSFRLTQPHVSPFATLMLSHWRANLYRIIQ